MSRLRSTTITKKDIEDRVNLLYPVSNHPIHKRLQDNLQCIVDTHYTAFEFTSKGPIQSDDKLKKSLNRMLYECSTRKNRMSRYGKTYKRRSATPYTRRSTTKRVHSSRRK
jgi:hypothetical protein